ncbi:PREDICTED: protein MAK16 homolog [Ipomoea nil]|uniref:protein MAK16 homolog n=1 Tax=Ipomoea nil TaxID=35883 RepID=UPI0009016352|nr:PREDICTED: protein MAK16 homolog [Ipomoea nil]
MKEVVPEPETYPNSPPSRDQLLQLSIESDYQRVLKWQKWRTSPLRLFLENFDEMKDEEDFALEWLGTQNVYEATRLETINRAYSYKLTNRSLTKGKAPICLEMKKPYLDPAFEEEMKEFRAALLLSKIKTELEKLHQNDPACNISGSKDENGNAIEKDVEPAANKHPDEEDNADRDGEEEDNDIPDDEDEENDDEEDDDNGDNDDDSDDDDSDYDSESPIIGNTEIIPKRSPTPHSFPHEETHPRDPSPSAPPPIDSQIAARPNSDGKMEASPPTTSQLNPKSPRDDKMEASPSENQFILEQRNVFREPKSIHLEPSLRVESLDPENIMHHLLTTIHQVELLHQQYSFHRKQDSQTLEDLSTKMT